MEDLTSHRAGPHKADYGGLRWHRYGDPAAPSVVLLHPVATDASIWAAQAAMWQDRFDVIAIDLPGHGGSAAIGGNPAMADYAAHVARSLRAGGVERAAIVGLSIGSMIAQCLAADHPAMVQAAVLANGAAWTTDAARQVWETRIASARTGGMEPLRDAMLQRWFTPEFLLREPDIVAGIGDLIVATPARGFIEAAGAIQWLDNRAALSRIACPTLVMAGERDGAAPPAIIVPIAEAIPGARYVCLPAAHLVNVELADRFTSEVGQFLDVAMARAA